MSMVDDQAVYLFSNETVHRGRGEIRKAIQHNFESIQDESYSTENLTWLAKSEEVAVCVYDYAWNGVINGERLSGAGRGTTVLRRMNHEWKIVHEHLSRGKFAA